MTEASKQRMQELEDAMVQHWRENFKTTADGYGLKRYGFKRGYEAGFNDPDAKKIFVGGVYWDAEKIEELIRNHTNQNVEAAKSLRGSLVLIEKLEAENKKLREAMQFAVDHLSSMGDYSIVNGAIHSLKEALSSGGE